MKLSRLVLCTVAALLGMASAMGQGQEFRGPPGGGDFRGGGPGGGFPGGGFPGGPGGGDFRGRGGSGDFRGGRGGFDPRAMLTQFDANGNGTIEPSEMQGRGEFVRRMAERAGMDPNQPVSIDRLTSSFGQMRQGEDRNRDDRDRDDRNRDDRNRDDRNRDERNRDERDRDDRNRSSNAISSTPPPPVVPQGFGAAGSVATSVPGFDTPLIAGVSAVPIEKRFDARVIEYVKERMLEDRDANNNGMLERNEWTGSWRSSQPAEMDLNRDGILTLEEMCTQVAKRFASEGSRRDGESRGESRGEGRGSFGGGFGPPGGGFGPSGGGFGPPGGGFGPQGGNFGSGGDSSNNMRRYAESLLRQYDENRSGRLERDEWQRMRSEHHAADTSADGIITTEELTAHLQKSTGSSVASRSGDKSQSARRSYRTSTPIERLPKGMPDWFLRNDLDADGQISMAEYATSWNDQIASEFLKIDANGDGIITPDEAQPGDSGRR